jgi:hypothetical protein
LTTKSTWAIPIVMAGFFILVGFTSASSSNINYLSFSLPKFLSAWNCDIWSIIIISYFVKIIHK